MDTGCLVALQPSVNYDIQFVGKVKTALFGGEGLFFATLTGPGHVWLQSLPLSRLADRIYKAAPADRRQPRGRGLGARPPRPRQHHRRRLTSKKSPRGAKSPAPGPPAGFTVEEDAPDWRQAMRLLIQPEDGVRPLLDAINGARRRLDLYVFRLDRDGHRARAAGRGAPRRGGPRAGRALGPRRRARAGAAAAPGRA